MMQPVQNPPPQRSTETGVLTMENNNPSPISSNQLRLLNTLITQLSPLTGQSENELWVLLRQDIGLNTKQPLLSRHFPAAEQHLNQRLIMAQQRFDHSQLLNQISELIGKNNSLQTVSRYMIDNFGHRSLHSLNHNQLLQLYSLLVQGQAKQPPLAAMAVSQLHSDAFNANSQSRLLNPNVQNLAQLNPSQLNQLLNQLISQDNQREPVNHYLQRQYGHQTVNLLNRQQRITLLTLLLNGELTTASTPAVSLTRKSITPSEFNTLNQLVHQLASTRQQLPERIWKLMLTLSGTTNPQQILQHHFTPLTHWLLTSQYLSQHYFSQQISAQQLLDLQQLQQHLQQQNPPVSTTHWQQLSNYAQQHWQLTPQTPLNALQTEQLLDLLVQLQIKQPPPHQQQQARYLPPIFTPLANLLTAPVATLSSKPVLTAAAVIVVLVILWLLL